MSNLSVISLQLVSLLALFFSSCGDEPSPGAPRELRIEYLETPLALDTMAPRFSWQIHDNRRGAVQSAYQIQVTEVFDTSTEGEALLWDSGKIESHQSLNIPYRGPALKSNQRYHWKVRSWDQDNKVSGYSEPAWWETGLLNPEDWQAQWIGDGKGSPKNETDFYREDPAPLFRKTFQVDYPVIQARLHFAGLGYGEAYLNGKKAGTRVLDPGWTNYGKRILYSTFDVTEHIKQGQNVVGVMLGNGWYNPLPMRLFGRFNLREHLTIGRPRLIAQLHLTFENNTSRAIVSDSSWKFIEGPLLKNDTYLGEIYDARREQTGWNQSGFDDSQWHPARIMSAPGGRLVAQLAPPIRITRKIQAQKLTQPQAGIFIFDLGQNFAGWVRLRVQGPRGTAVQLRYGELLHPDGTLNVMTTVAGQIKAKGRGGPGAPDIAWQTDTYVLKGGETETYTPRFTFKGFRYVEVTNYPGTPTLDSLEGLRLNSDLKVAGRFECSNPLLNRIQRMSEWTFLSNVFSVQSDCPAREKFGYGGDMVAAGEALIFNFDMTQFYAKTVLDFQDDVRPNGGMPETAPFNGIDSSGLGEGSGPIGWQLAHPHIQQQLYRFYGNKRILEEQYETTCNLVELLKSKAVDHFIEVGLSDHESLDPKPAALTSTAFYYHIVELLAEFAKVLGHPEDYERYAALAQEIKTAFVERFVQPATGKVGTGTQGSQAFALNYGLLPEIALEAALGRLIREILVEKNGHLSTGIFGTKMLFDVLRTSNRPDVAWTLATQEDFPGWGFMLNNGATTLWETWKLDSHTYSHNHPMFGSVSEWFYRTLAGINPAEDAVGFDKIVIKPAVVGDLQWVRSHYDSVRGRISVKWKRDPDSFRMEVVIPANTSAVIQIPLVGIEEPNITENGQPLLRKGNPAGTVVGLQLVQTDSTSVICTAEPGHYIFEVK